MGVSYRFIMRLELSRLAVSAFVAQVLLLGACVKYQSLDGVENTWREIPADRIQVGTTTQADILEWLGPPSKISAIPSGSVFLYEHVEIRERQWGLILPGDISRFFKFVHATSVANTDVAVFVFDEEGILDWGMAMIQPLPVGLNVAQSLDSGSRGLDVIRVDGMMGQRALELNQLQ
jgi:hypothetical protein